MPIPTPRRSIIQRKQSLEQSVSASPPFTPLAEHTRDDVFEGNRSLPFLDGLYDKPAAGPPIVSYPPPSFPPPPLVTHTIPGRSQDIDDQNFQSSRMLEELVIKESLEAIQSLDTVPKAPGSLPTVMPHVYVNCSSPDQTESTETPPPIPPRKTSISQPYSRSPSIMTESDNYKILPGTGSQNLFGREETSSISSSSSGLAHVSSPQVLALEPTYTASSPSISSHSMSSDTLSLDADKSLNGDEVPLFPKTAATKTGYLFKSGPDRKTLSRRWFTLDSTALSYYKEEPVVTAGVPKPRSGPSGVVYIKDMLLITICVSPPLSIQNSSRFQKKFSVRNAANNNNPLFYFEVGVDAIKEKEKGRLFLLAAENEDDGRKWMNCIGSSLCPKIALGIFHTRKVSCMGRVKVRLNLSGVWISAWISVSDRQMDIVLDHSSSQIQKYFELPESVLSTPREEEYLIIDLRKVQSVAFAPATQIKPCASCTESDGEPICIQRQNDGALYIQADFTTHTDIWLKMIAKEWTVPANGQLKDQYLTTENVPLAIERCLNFLATYGGVATKGIYRLSGQMSIVRNIFESLKSGNKIWSLHMRPEDGITVHDVVSALKMYLRSFTECILTEDILTLMMSNNDIEDREERLKNIKKILLDLPPVNYFSLKRIIGHLSG